MRSSITTLVCIKLSTIALHCRPDIKAGDTHSSCKRLQCIERINTIIQKHMMCVLYEYFSRWCMISEVNITLGCKSTMSNPKCVLYEFCAMCMPTAGSWLGCALVPDIRSQWEPPACCPNRPNPDHCCLVFLGPSLYLYLYLYSYLSFLISESHLPCPNRPNPWPILPCVSPPGLGLQ